MKQLLCLLVVFTFSLLLSQRSEAQVVCGPDGCYEVQAFTPVRSTIDRTVSVLESVVELPPVPVTYAVQQVANRQFRPVKFVRTKFLRPIMSRVFQPFRRLFRR